MSGQGNTFTYDVANDFAAVAAFGSVPNVTVISPGKGIKNLPELVAAAKKGSFSSSTGSRRSMKLRARSCKDRSRIGAASSSG